MLNQPNIKKNVILNTIYQILQMVVPLVTTPYVSRVLGTAGVGIYSFTSSIQTYFAMLAALGTVSYGAREIARNRDEIKKRSQLFWEIEVLTVFTTMVSCILWGTWIWNTSHYKIYYVILSLNLIAILFDISWFYTGMEQFKYIIIQNSFFKLLAVFFVFLFVKEQGDLDVYILIMSLATLFGNLGMWMYLPRFVKKPDWKNFHIKHHFKETLVYFIPTIATSIYTVLDKVLIGFITHDEFENGYYEQATKIINMAKTIAFVSINSVLGARISYLFKIKKYDEIKERIQFAMDIILFLGQGMCFGILALGKQFVPLFFGEGYENVIFILYILSPIVIIIGISNCLGSLYYNPAGLRAKSAKYIIIGSIVNLVLNFCFIPQFQSNGAAIATLFSEVIITVLYLYNCKGVLSVAYIFKHLWKKIVAGLVMFISISLIIESINNRLMSCLVGGIIGAIIYIFILWILNDSIIRILKEWIYSLQIKSQG